MLLMLIKLVCSLLTCLVAWRSNICDILCYLSDGNCIAKVADVRAVDPARDLGTVAWKERDDGWKVKQAKIWWL